MDTLNEEQCTFILLYLVFLVFAVVTHGSIIARPIRLLTTFIHEFSHALACWLTGGEVREIEVYSNAGGVTRYVGGCRCIISSAGYLGESFWGMVAVILSGGRKTSTVAAGGLIFAFSISLCYRPNWTLVMLTIFYILLLSAFISLEWFMFSPLLPYVILYFGVYLGYFAITDIADHLVVQSTVDSDAYHLYIESGKCCPPRCIGFWWLINAILMQTLGALIAIMQLSNECKDNTWMECIFNTHLDFDIDWERIFSLE